MNQRFLFYKMTHKDSEGKHLMPNRGSGFDFLNKNMMQFFVDSGANSMLKQAKQLNVDLASMLENASMQINQNYENYC